MNSMPATKACAYHFAGWNCRLLVGLPSSYASGGASGTGGILSASDYVVFDSAAGSTATNFFSSYYEADYSQLGYSYLVYYYAYNADSGDIYYGYTFDNGMRGYYEGQYLSTLDENGSVWGYMITDVSDIYYSCNGYNFVSAYTDGETGITVKPYKYTYGVQASEDGIGSIVAADLDPGGGQLVYYYAYDTSTGDTSSAMPMTMAVTATMTVNTSTVSMSTAVIYSIIFCRNMV